MKNIAVMISGHPKGIQNTYKLFKHWNNLYDNINFDFFISVWENDYDEKYFNWATKYEFLKESDCPYDLKNHETLTHQPHYCYALYRVNQLRNSYNKKYDAVFQTRTDSVFSRVLLNSIVENLIQIRGGLIAKLDNDGNYTGESMVDNRPDPQISDKNILSASGTFIHNYIDKNNNLMQNLWTQDVWFVGTPKVMDIFCNMFNYIFIEKKLTKDIPIMLHIFQAEYLNIHQIYNCGIASGTSYSFLREPERFTFNYRGGGYSLDFPSPKQLTKLIEDKGLGWFYDNEKPKQRWYEIQDYFKETEK